MKWIALLALTGLTACASAPIKGGTYPLQPGQRVSLSGTTTLTYDSFSDSRCPANARCVWAGRLSFQFVLNGPEGAEEFSLGPDQLAATPKALHGARVALDPASIPPVRSGVSTRPGYVIPVTLNISSP
ncbi:MULTISPECIES: hypothetical protein [unclassified Massilia]|uniref:hypothetical protein n=1 Tax=unclassified Massilia TaxID=2609279 RepID=UPI000691C1FB|nr:MULTISPECIES: hypothetical protein [unclassified Massilia]AWG45947.1 hypothetical protein AM586_28175 [Massilia sp. WG5]